MRSTTFVQDLQADINTSSKVWGGAPSGFFQSEKNFCALRKNFGNFGPRPKKKIFNFAWEGCTNFGTPLPILANLGGGGVPPKPPQS